MAKPDSHFMLVWRAREGQGCGAGRRGHFCSKSLISVSGEDRQHRRPRDSSETINHQWFLTQHCHLHLTCGQGSAGWADGSHQ